MNNNISELREQLTGADIKRILAEYQVYPFTENNAYIVFPTCCHNLNDGSPKLYYYFKNSMFVCYTHCGSFDIFDLIIKLEKLRNNNITLRQAIQRAGLEVDSMPEENLIQDVKKAEQYLNRIQKIAVPHAEILKEINNNVLNKYSNDVSLLEPWINEGMKIEALKRFNILYDKEEVAIVIPHRDINGKIIGIRGRFMEENAPNKYMPLTYMGNYMAHPLRENLYGIYENLEVLKEKKIAFIFESEKSVILFESYFGQSQNFSVATCGNKISNEQIELLKRIGINEVVLCYDKDYDNYNDMLVIQGKYINIGKKLMNFFKTSIIMDYSNLLNYKDSPIDQGGEIFKELYKYRYYL